MMTEPQVARLAALRAEVSDVERLNHYDRAAAHAESWASWDQWDELFHRAVAEAGGNGLMISAIDQILRVKKRTPWSITRATTFDPVLRDRYAAEHRAVIEAIAAHDPRRAEGAMELHIRGISSSIGPATTPTARRRT